MPSYRAPLDDIRFVLTELLDVGELAALPGYEDATPDLLLAVLEEGAKVCEEVLFPLNASGDAEGVVLVDGVVRTPTGFREAYATYAAGGWVGLNCASEHGGQGLPATARFAIDEMVCASNLSFGMYPGLTLGAYEGLLHHANDEIKATYLPKLATGEWSGTMCLTEAHAGTDLGIIRSKAEPCPDGSYRITGTKIFISAGEHDLTPNIVHLVLAKLPGAPEGTRGISMFVVPKVLPAADGSLGARNAVVCGAIEHKMGIKGSATCVINFDGATGWLVGEPNKGMRAMFTMMNAARLAVGLQGLGLAEVSYQNAVAYARDRQQGRSLTGVKSPGTSADPIIVHADVKRGLLTMRAFIEGARALAAWIAMRIDVEMRHPDPAKREEAADLVALMTPIIKAYFTDVGFECTNIGLQTFGGHGYIRESGMEQYVRDARIGQIYEGTNHIQALDLVGRKLPEGGGRLFKRYATLVGADLARAQATPALAELASALGAGVDQLQKATMLLAQRGMQNPDEAGAAASEYLRLFGLVALGHQWLNMAAVAHEKLASGGDRSPAFYTAKLQTARFFFQRVLPQAGALFAAIAAGAESITAFNADSF